MNELQLSGFDIKKPMHAYLIAASGASASREYAAFVAKTLLCEDPDDGKKPCGGCPGCKKCDASSHPDITVLGRERVSVNDIRAINEDAYLSANEGSRKIFILEGIDKFNPQSQNALLKTLEEPPYGVVFIITASSKTGVLPTILSRCCVLTAPVCDYEYHEKNAREILADKADDESVRIIAAYLDCYGDTDAKSLDAQVVISSFRAAEDYFTGRDTNIVARMPKKKASKSSDEDEQAETLSKSKAESAKKESNNKSRQDMGIFIKTLMLYLRNVAVYKQSGGKCAVRPINEDFRKICVKLSAKRAIALYDTLEKVYLLSESNANPNAIYAYLTKCL